MGNDTVMDRYSSIEEMSKSLNMNIKPEHIKAILINEIVPAHPKDDFYGGKDAAYLSTTIPLFQSAGIDVNSFKDILNLGIYITNAVKYPKSNTTVDKKLIDDSLPYLEQELSFFPNVEVIMLMGDVAKKAMNMISKKTIHKHVIPAISTYKLRNCEFYYENIRVIPSYIMTGKNILIEKSKFQMASEDIHTMYQIIKR